MALFRFRGLANLPHAGQLPHIKPHYRVAQPAKQTALQAVPSKNKLLDVLRKFFFNQTNHRRLKIEYQPPAIKSNSIVIQNCNGVRRKRKGSFPNLWAFVLTGLFGFSSGASSDPSKPTIGGNKFAEYQVAPDGNCLFRAISHQMYGTEEKYKSVRSEIVSWLKNNENFPVDEDGTILKDFLETDVYGNWNRYCQYMSRDSTWGDHIALIAAAEVFKSKIQIQSTVPSEENTWIVIEPKKAKAEKTLWLKHYHELHYNSLVPLNKEMKSKM